MAPISAEFPLVLGSASPRRRELLERFQLPLRVVAPDVDESVAPGEDAEAYLQRMIGAKLGSVAEQLNRDLEQRVAGAVLVADTVVLLGARILGKPASVTEAAELVGSLVGRSHRVKTAYAIAGGSEPRSVLVTRSVETRVTMRAATPAEVRAYAESKEGLDKAGAYAIQGLGAFLVERIDGSYPNVVGLPVCEVVRDLVSIGLLVGFP